MNKEYLKYLLKTKKFLFIFLAAIELIALAIIIIPEFSPYSQNNFNASLITTFIIAFISCFILPPLMLNIYQNKKAVDVYIALPFSRKELIITTIVASILMIFTSWLIPNLLLLILNPLVGYHFLWNLVYILIVLVIFTALIIFNYALFLIGNSTFDGILMMIAYLVLPAIITISLIVFQEQYIVGYTPINFGILGWTSLPFICLSFFIKLIHFITGYYNIALLGLDLEIIALIFYIILNILFLNTLFNKRKFENTETRSNKFYAYPLLIYIYTFILTLVSTSISRNESIILYLMLYLVIFVFFAILQFIYHRKIYLNTKTFIFFFISIAISFGICTVFNNTRGLGLSKTYLNNQDKLESSIIDYNLSFTLNNDDVLYNIFTDYLNKDEAYQEFINEYNYYNENYYYVYISANNRIYNNNPKFNEVLTYFNTIRDEAIEYHYQNDYIMQKNAWFNFNIIDNYQDQSKDYYYYSDHEVSIEEIKLLAKLGIRLEMRVNDYSININDFINYLG